MENISDFFKDLKERLASPFFSSFIIAWLIINYRIIIVLIFYKQEQLNRDQYNSFLDVIEKNSGTNQFLIFPLLSALGYVLLFPPAKVLMQAFSAFVQSHGSKLILKASREGKISVGRYLVLREKYEELIREFSDKTENEYLVQQENESLLSTNKNLVGQLSSVMSAIKMWELLNDMQFLSTIRAVRFSNPQAPNQYIEYIFNWEPNKINLIRSGLVEKTYMVKAMVGNLKYRYIIFKKEGLTQDLWQFPPKVTGPTLSGVDNAGQVVVLIFHNG